MSTSFWNNEAMAPPPSQDEKKSYDRFVDEYLLDYDGKNAAIRVGYSASFAADYAARFLEEPYVRQRIKAVELEVETDPKKTDEIERKKLLAALNREAHYRGPGSSHAARVAALGKLASLRDMDQPIKVKNDHSIRGGVMAVPAIASIEDWERASAATQNQLKQDSAV